MKISPNPYIVKTSPRGQSVYFLDDEDSPYHLGEFFSELGKRPKEKAALVAILKEIAQEGIEPYAAISEVGEGLYLLFSPEDDCLALLETDDGEYVVCAGGKLGEGKSNKGLIAYLNQVQSWHRERLKVEDD